MNKRHELWRLDCLPAESNVVFKKDGVDYYHQHLFHTSGTIDKEHFTPMFVKDVHELVKLEQIYLTMPLLKNLYLYQNHPIHQLEIYGRCLGTYYNEDRKFVLCFIDDGSCQMYLTCKIPLENLVPNLQHKFLKLQGTLRQYKSVKELNVSNYEVLGDESNFKIQFESWFKLLKFRDFLKTPWHFVNEAYQDEEDLELTRIYDLDHETGDHSMTRAVYNDDANEFEIIVISDTEEEESDTPIDLTLTYLTLKFEFARFCLESGKTKLSLQEVFNHLNKQLTNFLTLKIQLENDQTSLKKLKFDIFHGVRHELTRDRLIRCTTNLNCKIQTLITLLDNVTKTLHKMIKNQNYVVKLNIQKFIDNFMMKNEVTVEFDFFNKLVEFYIAKREFQGDGVWSLQGNEWVFARS